MIAKKAPRERDPMATRAKILAAARTLLAKDGPEGLSVVQVANLAGINRGTAYQHFPDRARLLHATIASVSEALVEAVFPKSQVSRTAPGVPFDDYSLRGSAGRLAAFTVENASFCRVWLFELLSSDDPGSDPFSRTWLNAVRAFCASDDALPGIDAEAFAVFTLMAYLSWPVWVHAEKLKPRDRQLTGQRLVDEVLRLSMYGSMRADHFPTVRKALVHDLRLKSANKKKKMKA